MKKVKDITIKVTEENITDGVPANSSCCPIALAVIDAFPDIDWMTHQPSVDSDGAIYICKITKAGEHVKRNLHIEVSSDTRYDLEDFIYNYDERDGILEDDVDHTTCNPWKFDGQLMEMEGKV